LSAIWLRALTAEAWHAFVSVAMTLRWLGELAARLTAAGLEITASACPLGLERRVAALGGGHRPS
jgi:hypothetical protein